MNKYLEKIAGLPGSFLTAAKQESVRSVTSNQARTVWSGLHNGPNVVGTKPKLSMGRTPAGAANFSQTNPMLRKMAEMVVNKDKDLPYRRRVEVMIFKGDKVLVLKNEDTEKKETWFTFPGGGTEGESDESAARKECLEEVSIKVKDLVRTDIFKQFEGISNKDNRGERYRGTRTRVYRATFDGTDSSIQEKDHKGRKTSKVWMSKEEAIEAMKKNKVDSAFRVKALKENWPN